MENALAMEMLWQIPSLRLGSAGLREPQNIEHILPWKWNDLAKWLNRWLMLWVYRVLTIAYNVRYCFCKIFTRLGGSWKCFGVRFNR